MFLQSIRSVRVCVYVMHSVWVIKLKECMYNKGPIFGAMKFLHSLKTECNREYFFLFFYSLILLLLFHRKERKTSIRALTIYAHLISTNFNR